MCFPNGALQQSHHPAADEDSRDPAPHSGGVLVFGKSCAVGFSAVVLKLMETLKVTEAPLPGSSFAYHVPSHPRSLKSRGLSRCSLSASITALSNIS
jgi:hypothetical protein